MPIIVDEVVISVEVEPPTQPANGPAAPAAGNDRQALVAEVVERVLEILHEREEP